MSDRDLLAQRFESHREHRQLGDPETLDALGLEPVRPRGRARPAGPR